MWIAWSREALYFLLHALLSHGTRMVVTDFRGRGAVTHGTTVLIYSVLVFTVHGTGNIAAVRILGHTVSFIGCPGSRTVTLDIRMVWTVAIVVFYLGVFTFLVRTTFDTLLYKIRGHVNTNFHS